MANGKMRSGLEVKIVGPVDSVEGEETQWEHPATHLINQFRSGSCSIYPANRKILDSRGKLPFLMDGVQLVNSLELLHLLHCRFPLFIRLLPFPRFVFTWKTIELEVFSETFEY